jgi:hypothetical protein
MSNINGDKARHNRMQKSKAKKRAKLRAFLPEKSAPAVTKAAAAPAAAAVPAPGRTAGVTPPRPARSTQA